MDNTALIAAFAFALGAIIGSFCNVVLFRYARGYNISGRSACPQCQRVLAWFELIPLFSYVALAGRCRTCRVPLSAQYPLVELATAIAYAAIALALPDASLFLAASMFAVSALFATALILIFVYDIYYTIIPDGFVITAALAALATHIITPAGLALPAAELIVAGIVLAAPIALLWYVSAGRWIGLGDAKLMVAVGWFFGLAEGASVLVVAVWCGAITGLVLIGMHKIISRGLMHALGLVPATLPRTIYSEIPFGPFIIASVALHVLTDVSALGIASALTVGV